MKPLSSGFVFSKYTIIQRMAHPEQRVFIQEVKAKFGSSFHAKKVLEVGSLNINGTVRDYFTECDYTGIDLGEGPGVDIVSSGHNFLDPDSSYDTVISCECFEHNPFWYDTFINMHRLCKSSGLIIMTCATTGRAEHGTHTSNPQDSPLTIAQGWTYYRNLTESDFEGAFFLSQMFSEYKFSTNEKSHDLYFYGLVS